MCCTPHRRPTCTAQSFLQSCLGRGCNCYANSIPLRGVSSSEAHYLYLIDNRPQSTVARISHGLPSERLPVYTARLGLYYTNGLMQPDLRVLLCGTPHKFSSVTAPTPSNSASASLPSHVPVSPCFAASEYSLQRTLYISLPLSLSLDKSR